MVVRGNDELAQVTGEVTAHGAGELSKLPGDAFLREPGWVLAADQQVFSREGEDELAASAEEELLVLRHRSSNVCILHLAQYPLFVELWLYRQVRLDLPDA